MSRRLFDLAKNLWKENQVAKAVRMSADMGIAVLFT